MIPVLTLAACGGPDDPSPPDARVLTGPFVGRGLAIAGDALWVSAPGPTVDVDDPASWSRLRAPARGGALADADRVITAGAEGDLGGGLAVCADGTVVAGAPDRGGKGGAWLLGPDDDTTGDQAFLEGLYEDGRAGVGVACGNLDGDGGPDVVVTAPAASGVIAGAGTLGVWELVDDGTTDKIASLDTTWANARLGDATALVVADVLGGDGVQDLIVAGPGSDRVHVVPGPLHGSYVAASAGPLLQGTDGEETGASLAVGDLSGDGVPDLVIGTPAGAGGRGGAWIVTGPLDAAPQLLRDGARWLGGISIGARLGAAVAIAGDVDGDGRDDLLLGAPGAPGAGPDAGAAYLVLAATLDGMVDIDGADAILLPEAPRGRFGSAVAAGDLDGDGVRELYVSAPEADVDGATGVGEVVVFPATARGTVYDTDGASGTIRP